MTCQEVAWNVGARASPTIIIIIIIIITITITIIMIMIMIIIITTTTIIIIIMIIQFGLKETRVAEQAYHGGGENPCFFVTFPRTLDPSLPYSPPPPPAPLPITLPVGNKTY